MQLGKLNKCYLQGKIRCYSGWWEYLYTNDKHITLHGYKDNVSISIITSLISSRFQFAVTDESFSFGWGFLNWLLGNLDYRGNMLLSREVGVALWQASMALTTSAMCTVVWWTSTTIEILGMSFISFQWSRDMFLWFV